VPHPNKELSFSFLWGIKVIDHLYQIFSILLPVERASISRRKNEKKKREEQNQEGREGERERERERERETQRKKGVVGNGTVAMVPLVKEDEVAGRGEEGKKGMVHLFAEPCRMAHHHPCSCLFFHCSHTKRRIRRREGSRGRREG